MRSVHPVPVESSPPRFSIALSLVFASPLPGMAGLAEVAVTECGQLVEDGAAVLTTNLDCSAHEGSALFLKNARLEMMGFTISGNPAYEDPFLPGKAVPVVDCFRSRCRVDGPGTITGGGGGASPGGSSDAGAISGGNVRVSDVTFEGNGGTAITATKLQAKSCTIRNNAGNGVLGSRRASIVDTSIESNGLRGVVGVGTWGNFKIVRSSIVDHPADGVLVFGVLRVRDSVVAGNGTSLGLCLMGDPDPTPCVDLSVGKKFRIETTECGSSYQTPPAAPTGLCSND